MIVDQHGSLVWFRPLPAGEAATNLTVQRYGGRPALVWWQGHVLELGFGQGEVVIDDSAYRHLASVHAGNGYAADLHVIQIAPDGTAWLDAYDPVHMNLASAGGIADGVLSDSVLQEVDIRTGLVMWEWHALGHIPLADSKNPVPESSYPWDYVHINSLAPGAHDDVLLSFRNTWSLDDVDIHSGGLRWRLGGPRSTFKLPRSASFYWQHDGAFQPSQEISVFDNGSNPPKERQSRGLVLALDAKSHSARLVRQLVNPSRTLLASSQGSLQLLAGGNSLIGYGGLPDFTEFGPTGGVLLDGRLGPGVQNFRTTLAQWQGSPSWLPAVAVVHRGGATELAASWNGATEVSAWRLLSGGAVGHLALGATVARSGFETLVPVPAGARVVAVQALDAAGAVLGTSAPAMT
jgi:hypothetical protein